MSTVTETQSILMTEKQVAQLLGCCDRTVWQMRKDGKIRCVKIGAAVRYTQAEVDRFIEAMTTPLNEETSECS
ncbi:MAG: helix-turn-helix domain-containing protein [Planctomycetes bacterium]|nr:helix-turn-helix domain-containing protein [Planctomycetota bacterium]